MPSEPDASIRAVATMLGVVRATVWAMIKRGELPCYRIGPRVIRIPIQAVKDWRERKIAEGYNPKPWRAYRRKNPPPVQ